MKLAFITNKPYNQSETFIKAQFDRLPFEIFHCWGKRMPFYFRKDKDLSKKLEDKIYKKVLRENSFDRLVREFKKRRIDAVLAQYGMIGAEILPVCQELNLPLIVHFHGHDAVRKSVIKEYGARYSKMFQYSKTRVVSVSHEMTERLVKIGCPKDKITNNVYGPSEEFLKVDPRYDRKQFVGIGRFVEKKAPHLCILAFNKLLQDHPDVKLILAGDGVLLDSCKDLVSALKIEEHVEFPGRISPQEFRAYLEHSLAFVQHSIEARDGDMEGTPVAILEASGAGLPIISTRHAGIPDVVEHIETGLLCKERDIDEMARNMSWILENRDKAKIMGQEGKKRVAKSFSMDAHIDRLTRIIEKSIQ